MNRRDLEREARKYGATIQSDTVADNICLQVCSPDGMCWDEDLHMLVVTWTKGDEAWRDDSIADAIRRMKEYGVHKCECEQCKGVAV